MTWVIAVVVVLLILLLAPLRHRLLANGVWAFTLPAVVAGVLAWRYAASAVASGAPRILLILLPVPCAIGVGIGAWTEVCRICRQNKK